MSTTSESLDLVDKEESVEKRSLECTCSISINGSCNRDEAPEDAETSRSDHDEFQDTLSQRRRLPLCGDERIWAPVLSVMVVASLPALLFGCTLGFPSPVLLDLMESDKQEFRFDTLLSDLFSVSINFNWCPKRRRTHNLRICCNYDVTIIRPVYLG